MKKSLVFIWIVLIFSMLTVLSQVGGLIFLIALFVKWKMKIKSTLVFVFLFLALYGLISALLVPIIAHQLGRDRIKHTEIIKPSNYGTVLLNRNYVVPEMNKALAKAEQKLSQNNSPIQIHYLDANFPFMDGFPLVPHLSHDDGKKLDLSLIYEDPQGSISEKQKSITGYGVFEAPKPHEMDQISVCKQSGYKQYDYSKFFKLAPINHQLVYSNKGTSLLLKSLLSHSEINKVFMEPHLVQRLNISDNRIRYHGCHSVRHDDHIHIQL